MVLNISVSKSDLRVQTRLDRCDELKRLKENMRKKI